MYTDEEWSEDLEAGIAAWARLESKVRAHELVDSDRLTNAEVTDARWLVLPFYPTLRLVELILTSGDQLFVLADPDDGPTIWLNGAVKESTYEANWLVHGGEAFLTETNATAYFRFFVYFMRDSDQGAFDLLENAHDIVLEGEPCCMPHLLDRNFRLRSLRAQARRVTLIPWTEGLTLPPDYWPSHQPAWQTSALIRFQSKDVAASTWLTLTRYGQIYMGQAFDLAKTSIGGLALSSPPAQLIPAARQPAAQAETESKDHQDAEG